MVIWYFVEHNLTLLFFKIKQYRFGLHYFWFARNYFFDLWHIWRWTYLNKRLVTTAVYWCGELFYKNIVHISFPPFSYSIAALALIEINWFPQMVNVVDVSWKINLLQRSAPISPFQPPLLPTKIRKFPWLFETLLKGWGRSKKGGIHYKYSLVK